MLLILQNDNVIASLERDSNRWKLSYLEEATQDINPALPRSKGTFHFPSPPRFFMSLLPRGKREDALTNGKKFAEVGSDVLTAAFAQCLDLENVGDLRVVPGSGGSAEYAKIISKPTGPNVVYRSTLDVLEEPKQREIVFKELEQAGRASGIGGAFSKGFFRAAEGIYILKKYEPLQGKADTDIDGRYMAKTEEMSLKAYRSVGGNAAQAAAYGDLLAVRRFDIASGNRRHSICHAADLEQTPNEYDGSYEKVVSRIREVVEKSSNADAAAKAARETARQVIFSWVLGDSDRHKENIALLRRNGQENWELAPAYDLLPSRFFSSKAEDMGLTINAKKNNIGLKDLCALGEKAGMNKKEVQEFIAQSVEAIRRDVLPEMPPHLQRVYAQHLTARENVGKGMPPKEAALAADHNANRRHVKSETGASSLPDVSIGAKRAQRAAFWRELGTSLGGQ